jgi:competence protein ComEC
MLLIFLSCAWVLGIFVGSLLAPPALVMLCALLPLPFALLFPPVRKRLLQLALCLVIFSGSVLSFPLRAEGKPPLAALNNKGRVEITGVVRALPETHDALAHIELSASRVKTGDSMLETRGTVLIFTSRYPEYRYGDTLTVSGNLENPPVFEDFDYQSYLAGQNIYSSMLNPAITVSAEGSGNRVLAWVNAARLKLAQSLSAALPEPQAGLAQGIFLGIRSGLPDDLKTDFSITGTAHILAISGINLTIVAGLLLTLGLWILGRRYYLYVWVGLLLIWFYATLTGLQAPVVRAAIMASVFLLCELLGRQKNVAPALALSAAIMVGVNPQVLWNVSFQLSFLAMIGLVIIAPPLQTAARSGLARLVNEANPLSAVLIYISDSLCITLAAMVLIWPVIAHNFSAVSLIGPLATLLIAPALTPIIFATALTSLVGLFSLPVARVIAWVDWFFLSYMLWLVNAFASPALAAFGPVAIGGAAAGIYYVLLGLAVRFGKYFKKFPALLKAFLAAIKNAGLSGIESLARVPKKFVIIPLLFLACFFSLTAATMPEKDLYVSILDVGEGDSILVRNGNQNILIDGGPGPQAPLLGLSRALPFWEHKLDLVVTTHPHQDHLGGLIEVLRNYNVEKVLTTDLTDSSTCFREWSELLKERSIDVTVARAGQRMVLNNGALLEVLNPGLSAPARTTEEEENNGMVLKLSRGRTSFLFTADIGPEAEADLISRRADLDCTVLKISHHGSASSSTAAFLAVAKPQAAVISVGADNHYGHPSPQVISRLQALPMPSSSIFRTDLSGSIDFTTDGRRLWVKTER